MRILWLGLSTMLLALAACGSGDPTEAGQATDGGSGADAEPSDPGDAEDGGSAPAVEDLSFRCGAVNLPGRSVDLDSLRPFTDDLASFVDQQALEEFDVAAISSLTLYEVERTDDRLVLLGERDASVTGAVPYFDAVFALTEDGWRATGWGDCWMTTEAPGYGVAQLALDPNAEPTAESDFLALLATERACASGQVPVDREIVPLVVESQRSIQVLVLVEELTTDANCPSNPPFPVTVELSAPLGDRTILDTALNPPTELVWPIPVRPSELSVAVLGEAPAPGTANVFTWSNPSAGGLMLQPAVWDSVQGWVQSFPGDVPRTIGGFVGECPDGPCEEECEGAGCDGIVRLGPECRADYEVDDANDTNLTIIYSGTTCTIEVTRNAIAE